MQFVGLVCRLNREPSRARPVACEAIPGPHRRRAPLRAARSRRCTKRSIASQADAAADSATLNYELMTGGADVSDGSDASPAAQALATRGALEPMQHPVVILAFNEASQVRAAAGAWAAGEVPRSALRACLRAGRARSGVAGRGDVAQALPHGRALARSRRSSRRCCRARSRAARSRGSHSR